MYAGMSPNVNDNDNLDIPEWKKILIMKRKTNQEEQIYRNSDKLITNINIPRNCDTTTCDKFRRSVKVSEQDFQENSSPKTVTIGHINVELRTVKSSVDNQDVSKLECNGMIEYDDDDLQYGPGIVDRLRAKFLNIGAKKQRKPVVRRFSSLENLPGSNTGLYRINARSIRQNGFKVGSGNYGSGNVKKAQSMETLISSTTEQLISTSIRRSNVGYVGGVKARILAKTIPPIAMFTDQNEESNEKSPPPSTSPRLFAKFTRRLEYNRSASASNINEDELPKPDTVKHVKRIFESPPLTTNTSEKTRFRKIPGTSPPPATITPTSICSNIAISPCVRPVVKKLATVEDSSPEDAKTSAKVSLDVNTTPKCGEIQQLSPEMCNKYEINKEDYSTALEEELSPNGSCDTSILQKNTSHLINSADGFHHTISSLETTEENLSSSFKVISEQLPLQGCKHSTGILSQDGEVNGAELSQEEDLSIIPHPASANIVGPDEEMIVAAAVPLDTFSATSKKGAPWQKAPRTATSIVFDFRGKDVKPNIALQPTPFGCRPAKVSKNNTNSKNKRSCSPMRTGVNGIDLPPKDYDVNDEHTNVVDDEEDWDEMDIGADLPAISGIFFSGENVKIGRGAFLETRNKKLTLQFDDHATSTFEYPSENTSPMEENSEFSDSFDPSVAIDSEANSRMGLSNYTPQVLSSSNNFELGVSQANHRPNNFSALKNETKDESSLDAVVPANAEDAEGWSASSSADILF